MVSALRFQDDIANIAETVEAAQVTNDKMIDLLETKLLNLNNDKSKYLVA